MHRIFSSYAETLMPLKELDRLGPVAAGPANTRVTPVAARCAPSFGALDAGRRAAIRGEETVARIGGQRSPTGLPAGA